MGPASGLVNPCRCDDCPDCIPSPDGWDAFADKTGFSGEKKDSLGRRICYDNGKRISCAKPPPTHPSLHAPRAAKVRPSLAETAAKVQDLKAKGLATPEALADLLAVHTVEELKQVQKSFGVRAGGIKSERVRKIAEAALKLAFERVKDEGRDGGRGPGDDATPTSAGRSVAGKAGGPGDTGTDQGGAAGGQPAGLRTAESVPASVEEVGRRIDRYGDFFRRKGQQEVAGWLDMLKEHVNAVGTDEALRSLGAEVQGTGEDVQYGGTSEDMPGFAKAYLDRHGITPVTMGTLPAMWGKKLVSSVAPSVEGIPSRGEVGGKAEDVHPTLPTLKDKLEEAKSLPGLGKSEDVHKLLGKEVKGFSPDVVAKLDDTYGKGQWIVKSYGDEAYAGYGIFFPQRVAQINQDAKNTVWTSGQELSKYGFSHLRDESGKIVGVRHEGGDEYRFGRGDDGKPTISDTIHGDARKWALAAAEAAPHEKETSFPEGSFMAQPAFPVVGVSDADRAAGRTHEGTGEGRVHVVTRNGKAEVVPHSTWIKGEHLPVVFEDDNTRSMAKAALDAVNALPESERQGQLYAPDIVKTAEGHRAVEANPANEAGASGYLADNPFIIDSYVSHVTGREPAHVKFIRKLLTSRKEG